MGKKEVKVIVKESSDKTALPNRWIVFLIVLTVGNSLSKYQDGNIVEAMLGVNLLLLILAGRYLYTRTYARQSGYIVTGPIIIDYALLGFLVFNLASFLLDTSMIELLPLHIVAIVWGLIAYFKLILNKDKNN